MGMGMGGYGSPLLNSLMAGGLGYLIGNNAAQQATPNQSPMMVPMYQPYPYPVPAPTVPPQTPSYTSDSVPGRDQSHVWPDVAPQGPVSSPDNGKLAQLQLLGRLHDSGVLTDEEFEREKAQILGG
jgi:hypothetical protein